MIRPGDGLHGRLDIILAELVGRGDGYDIQLKAESGKVATPQINAGAACAFGVGIGQRAAQARAARMRE